MQPLLYKNDLALIRPETSYHVGDVVLYESQILHRPVLHRIFLIQNGNYFFKGDNNSFVDPGYATRAELVGKLWFHVPWVGGVLSWFGKPLHAALLASLAALAVAFAGFGTKPTRRGRRRRSASRTRSVELPMTRRRSPSDSFESFDSRAPRCIQECPRSHDLDLSAHGDRATFRDRIDP